MGVFRDLTVVARLPFGESGGSTTRAWYHGFGELPGPAAISPSANFCDTPMTFSIHPHRYGLIQIKEP